MAIILALRRSHPANLARDTGSCARSYIIPSALPCVILVECRLVVLEHDSEVVPECGSEFCCRVGQGRCDEWSVGGFGGVVFGPCWGGGLVVCECHFGDVGRHV